MLLIHLQIWILFDFGLPKLKKLEKKRKENVVRFRLLGLSAIFLINDKLPLDRQVWRAHWSSSSVMVWIGLREWVPFGDINCLTKAWWVRNSKQAEIVRLWGLRRVLIDSWFLFIEYLIDCASSVGLGGTGTLISRIKAGCPQSTISYFIYRTPLWYLA